MSMVNDEEILEELGQDSEEKGIKVANELEKEAFNKREKKDIDTHDKLETARSKKFDPIYYKSILAECNLRMRDYSLPVGFRWIAKVSKEGLAIFIEAPDRQQYGGGVKITMNPYDDAKGVVGLVNRALMDIEILEKQWKIQSSTKTKN